MRIAVLILGLVLSFISGIQSLAVAAGGSLSSDLSESASDKAEADKIASGGSMGIFGALLMLIGSALVMAKPKASMYVFGVAALFWLGAGGLGFSDGYIWAVVSVILAAMSWSGSRERAKADEKKREQYQEDLAAAAALLQAQSSSPPEPPPAPQTTS